MSDRAPAAPRMSAQDRRDQLLDILADLILSEGYSAVSIDRVAREAAVARTVVYWHFGNLEGLHTALAERTGLEILQQVRGILPDLGVDSDPDLLLIETLGGFLEAVAADPRTWRLALLPVDGAPIALRDRAEQLREAIIALMAPATEHGIARRGGPSELDADLAARLILAGAEEAGRLLLRDPQAFSRERLERFLAMLLAAIRRR